MLKKLHCKLNETNKGYCAWHKSPAHKHVHLVILAVFIFMLFPAVYSSYETAQAEPKILKFDNKNARQESVAGQVEFIDLDSGETLGQGRNKSSVASNVVGKKVKLKFVPDDGLVDYIEYDEVEIEALDDGLGGVLGAALGKLLAVVGNGNGNNGNGNNNGNNSNTQETVSEESDVEITLDRPETPPGWDNILAVGDVKGFSFSKGRYKKIATGKNLFKCLKWDFESQTCNGRWKKIADLVPGQEYLVEFAPGDPGYAEKSNKVTVLDKYKNLLKYSESETNNESDSSKKNITIVLEENTNATPDPEEPVAVPTNISDITVSAIDESSAVNELIISDLNEDSVTPEAFLIDTSKLASEEIKIIKRANSNVLLNCINFDDENSLCNRWKKDRDIVKDEDYTISISSPGKSVFGQARDGVIVLDKNLEVLSSGQESSQTSDKKQISVQLTDLNPNKVTTYFDISSATTSGEIILNTEASTSVNESGKTIAIDLNQAQVLGADIEGTAEGWDLFKCSDFNSESQTCTGKYKKTKNLTKGQNYSFNITKEAGTQGFFESKKKIAMLNADEELLTYTENERTENGKQVVEIVPTENPIQKITVTNPDPNIGNDIRISPGITTDQTHLQGYAIDPTQISAEAMELEVEAKGNTLYKCKDWDFAANSCLGVWVKIKDINPGVAYTLAIDSQDPGFMEVNEGSTPAPAPTPTPEPQPEVTPEPESTPEPQSSSEPEQLVIAEPVVTQTSSNRSGSTSSKTSVSQTTTTQVVNTPTATTTTNTESNNNYKAIIPSKTVFYRDLSSGAINNEIKELQKFLNKNGFIVSYTGLGAAGNESDYFGPATKKSLMEFQRKYAKEILYPLGLQYPTGIFGPSTKKFINSFKSI